MRRSKRSVKVDIMPELPEVETIKRVIEPQIQGLTIENVTVKRTLRLTIENVTVKRTLRLTNFAGCLRDRPFPI